VEYQYLGDLKMTPARAPCVTACADEIVQRVALLDNRYLTALSGGSMSIEHFRASQEQFFFAVRFYTRPMAALVSRVTDPVARLAIVRNLAEEHGDFIEEQFHQNTFRQFLQSIGGRDPEAAGLAVSPAVHAFNSILMGACLADDLGVAIGCMGIIEHAFAPISASIGKAVVNRGWVTPDRLVHYALHAELDVRHAEDFFAIIEPDWDDPPKRAALRQGLELGGYAFAQLYLGLNELGESHVTV
jgi:pyrroloquinoline-quinone synthase